MFQPDYEIEKYREITKNYKGNKKDAEYIINFFVKYNKQLYCNLCCIAFDNPDTIELILLNDECTKVMKDNDLLYRPFCVIGSDAYILQMTTTNCIIKNKKLLDYCTDLVRYVVHRPNCLKKLLETNTIDYDYIFKHITLVDFLSSECCEHLLENEDFKKFVKDIDKINIRINYPYGYETHKVDIFDEVLNCRVKNRILRTKNNLLNFLKLLNLSGKITSKNLRCILFMSIDINVRIEILNFIINKYRITFNKDEDKKIFCRFKKTFNNCFIEQLNNKFDISNIKKFIDSIEYENIRFTGKNIVELPK